MRNLRIEELKNIIKDYFESIKNLNSSEKLTSAQLNIETTKIRRIFNEIEGKSRLNFDGKVKDTVTFRGLTTDRLGLLIDIGIPNTQVTYDPFQSDEELLIISKGEIVSVSGYISMFRVADEEIRIFIENEIKAHFQPQNDDNQYCFIATACYGNYDAPEVLILRKFRDEKLLGNFFGKLFVALYYKTGPYFAKVIEKSDKAKGIVRHYLLHPIVTNLQRNNRIKSL